MPHRCGNHRAIPGGVKGARTGPAARAWAGLGPLVQGAWAEVSSSLAPKEGGLGLGGGTRRGMTSISLIGSQKRVQQARPANLMLMAFRTIDEMSSRSIVDTRRVAPRSCGVNEMVMRL